MAVYSPRAGSDGRGALTQIQCSWGRLVLLVRAATTIKVEVVPARGADTGDCVGDPRVGCGGVGRFDALQVDVAPGDGAVVAAVGEVSARGKANGQHIP